MAAGDWRNTSLEKSSFQVLLVTAVSRTGFGLVAVHHMANSGTMSPWESIFEPRQTVLELSGERVFGHQKGVVGEVAAWGTSCHRHLASQHRRFRLSCVESLQEKSQMSENVRLFHLGIARM